MTNFGADLRGPRLLQQADAPSCDSHSRISRPRACLRRAPRGARIDAEMLPRAAAGAMAKAASPQAIAEYRRRLKEYLEARAAFDQEAGAYWNSIAGKRRGRK